MQSKEYNSFYITRKHKNEVVLEGEEEEEVEEEEEEEDKEEEEEEDKECVKRKRGK